jgi:mutator protein MutT
MIIVVAAIIRRGAEILITRRFDHVHLPGLWEFPGGKVEPDESLEGALQREIREELGVDISVHEEYFSVQHEYPTKRMKLHFFNCTIHAGEPLPIEVADLKWVTPSELAAYPFPEADRELVARLQTIS